MSKKNKVQELEDYIDILQDALVAQQEISSEYYEMLVQAVDCYDLMMFGLHRGWIETSVAAQGVVDFLGSDFHVGASVDILRNVLTERPCPSNNEDDMVAFFDALVEEEEELGVQAAGADDVTPPPFDGDLNEEMFEFLPDFPEASTMADVMFRPFQDLFGPGFEDRGDDDPDWCDEDGCGCGV